MASLDRNLWQFLSFSRCLALISKFLPQLDIHLNQHILLNQLTVSPMVIHLLHKLKATHQPVILQAAIHPAVIHLPAINCS